MTPHLKNSQIFVQPAPTPLAANINRTDLLQIIMNLAKNALQCTDEPHKVIVQAGLQQHLIDGADEPKEHRPEAWINRDAVEHQIKNISVGERRRRARAEGTGAGLFAERVADDDRHLLLVEPTVGAEPAADRGLPDSRCSDR